MKYKYKIMANKNSSEQITGQKYYTLWEHGENPCPRIVRGKLQVYIKGVTYYGKILIHFPIYDDMNHVVFRFGKEIFSTLAYRK